MVSRGKPESRWMAPVAGKGIAIAVLGLCLVSVLVLSLAGAAVPPSRGSIATGPNLVVHLDGTGQVSPRGIVTFVAQVTSGGEPLTVLQASASAQPDSWQTVADLSGLASATVATGIDLTARTIGGSVAIGARTVYLRALDTAGRSAEVQFAVSYRGVLPDASDLPDDVAVREALVQLLARGVVLGYEAGTCAERGLASPCVGPADPTARAQMAALIARMMGWSGEAWDTPFTDRGATDEELWRAIGVLNHYGVARGYPDGGYQPTMPILQVQVIAFLARAMVAEGLWKPQPDDGHSYASVPATSGHREDVATFSFYTGTLPALSKNDDDWSQWDRPARRDWFAQAAWQLIEWREDPLHWGVIAATPALIAPSPLASPSATVATTGVVPPVTATIGTAISPTVTQQPTTVPIGTEPSPTATFPAATQTPVLTETPIPPTPTSAATATATQTPTPQPVIAANRVIQVGPGFSDVSPHQLVRTSGNVLYAIVPTCDSYPACPGATLRVYRADRLGTPGSFVEQAADVRPTGAGSSAIAIDGQDQIHVLWHDRAGFVCYAIFATATERWGAIETIEANGWTTFGQGDEGVALALDVAGMPHAVWNARGTDGRLQLRYATRAASGWASVVRVDDVTLAENHNAWHPTLAFTPTGDLLLAWLDGSFNYTPDGTIRIRMRAASGSWSGSQAIPDVAMTAIDNGPSLLVTPDGVRHLVFLDTGDAIRYWYDAGQGWRGDRQPARQLTHNPSLGPDGQGGVYLYGHGTPQGTIEGHGDNLYRFRLAAGATAWGSWGLYTTGAFDSSVSTRWAQFFQAFPERVDILYWADPYPNVLYAGSE